jgi:TrmH family RNA methyltransferase
MLTKNIITTITNLHTTKGRSESGYFIAQGLRTIATLSTHEKPAALYCTKDFLEQHRDVALPITPTIITSKTMEKISTTVTPSGILAIFKQKHHVLPEVLEAGLVLDHVQDPGNVGTLLRTAAALNIKQIYLIDSVDIYNPKVVQACAGILLDLTIFSCTLVQFLHTPKKSPLASLVIADGISIKRLPQQQLFFVVGNEGNGIRKELLKVSNYRITLPMPGNTESLNVAVAGSIALYLHYIN